MNGYQKAALVRNAADPEQVAKAARSDKRHAIDADDDLFNVMSTPFGRRFVWTFLGECGLYQNSFATDQRVMAYQCGQQGIAQALLSRLVTVCPDLYLIAQQEAQAMEKRDAAERQ